jgi:hypothetical protein
LQSLLGLLTNFRVGIGGCFSKFPGGGCKIAAICQSRPQIEVGFSEIRTKANGFAILGQGGVDLSPIFKKATEDVMCFGEIRVVFEGGFDVGLRFLETIHAGQCDSEVELVTGLFVVPDCFGEVIPRGEKIR